MQIVSLERGKRKGGLEIKSSFIWAVMKGHSLEKNRSTGGFIDEYLAFQLFLVVVMYKLCISVVFSCCNVQSCVEQFGKQNIS